MAVMHPSPTRAIVAGSGWGKTQLLQSIIADDLERDDPPGLVIVDSTGAMPTEAIRAVHRSTGSRGEWHHRGLAAGTAHDRRAGLAELSERRCHLPCPALSLTCFARLAARGAPTGWVKMPLNRKRAALVL